MIKKFNLEVNLVNLREETPKIEQYKNIVLGAGVRAGRVYGNTLKFLKQNFENSSMAFFICCGGAGDQKTYDASYEKYITNVLAKYPNVKPVATEAFGGRMKMFGKTLFDNVDLAKAQVWAETLGKKFAH